MLKTLRNSRQEHRQNFSQITYSAQSVVEAAALSPLCISCRTSRAVIFVTNIT